MRRTLKAWRLYLVRHGDREIWLAAEHDGRLYVYVANLKTFVYNGPASVDFLIDRDHTYAPIDVPEAAKIMGDGRIGKIDGRSNRWLIDHFRAEPRKLDPADVLGSRPPTAETRPR